jgi:hypothetical protein
MKPVFTATRLRVQLQSLFPGHARQRHVTKKKKVVHTDNAALKPRHNDFDIPWDIPWDTQSWE